MSLLKKFNQKKPVCKVTFILGNDVANAASKVNLAGDFNNWDIESIPMRKVKTGEFSVSVDLEKGKEYQFKYLIDGKAWMTETEADKQVPNVFQSENSVVVV